MHKSISGGSRLAARTNPQDMTALQVPEIAAKDGLPEANQQFRAGSLNTSTSYNLLICRMTLVPLLFPH